MSAQVIGFEGSWPEGEPVAWGAAAIEVGDHVSNSFSHHAIHKDDFVHASQNPDADSPGERLERYVKLPTSVKVELNHTDDIVVLGLDSSLPETRLLFPVRQQRFGIEGQTKGEHKYFYIFRTRILFRKTAQGILGSVFQACLSKDIKSLKQDDICKRAIRACLVLVPEDPLMNALRCVSSPKRARAMAFVRTRLEGENDALQLFETVMRVCQDDGFESWLKYSGGFATHGLDAADAAKQLSLISDLHSTIRKRVVHSIVPALKAEDAGLRITFLKASSAQIGFGVQLAGEPLFMRFARYVELDYFQRALRGDIPASLLSDAKFVSTLESILEPEPGTTVTQRALDSEEEEILIWRPDHARSGIRSFPFHILGYIQGFTRDINFIEIKFSSKEGPAGRASVSLRDDGDGNAPLGVDDVSQQPKRWVFEPAVFEVVQEVFPGRRTPKYHLKHILFIRTLTAHTKVPVTALPSYFRHAFLILPERITISAGSIAHPELDLEAASHALKTTLDEGAPERGSFDWIEKVSELSDEAELNYASLAQTSWTQVSSKRYDRAMRILRILDSDSGKVDLQNVTDVLISDYKDECSLYQVRRTIDSELHKAVAVDPRTLEVRLTARGYALLTIFDRLEAIEEE
ncbi:hypothetical protein [Enhygromyxa salina]|uniref:Uncharacterized protein n=1 Tax=Enhygromyxa salina TaxID=215803 RepID=A0A2S9YUS3_9BACT|nr:hypothetical protein [Enhygromyxa salina]PRQ08792.1 hypothetical protein ENSA7_14240 [Enhygromyxa salina]